MGTQRTLSIIKPDATRRNLTGKINARFEEKGLRIVAQRRVQLTRAQAEGFYAVHKDRPFFNDLCEFMISGPGSSRPHPMGAGLPRSPASISVGGIATNRLPKKRPRSRYSMPPPKA